MFPDEQSPRVCKALAQDSPFIPNAPFSSAYCPLSGNEIAKLDNHKSNPMVEPLDLSLAVAGLLGALTGLFGVDLGKRISSYKDCDTELSETMAELTVAKCLFDVKIRNLPPCTELPQRDLGALVSECRSIWAEAQQALARVQGTCQPTSSSTVIYLRQVNNLEAQHSFLRKGSASIRSKLNWSFGGKSALTKKVQLFTRYVSCIPCQNSLVPAGCSIPQPLDMAWHEKCIWIIHTDGRASQVQIFQCKTVEVSVGAHLHFHEPH